ncbi:MAG: prepilin peptidase, partial [Bdellovibrionales bacterium]|nr:prepilin peptidase [Bdellovibrionales bacterium]
ILPDVFTLSGIVIGLVGAVLNPEREFLPAVYGVLVGGGFLYALAYSYYIFRKKDGMGGGDIKLLAWIGAVLGVASIPFVILVSSVLGSLVGVFVAIQSRNGLKSGIPFGPYLALGAIIYILWGEELIHWYLNLLIPT